MSTEQASTKFTVQFLPNGTVLVENQPAGSSVTLNRETMTVTMVMQPVTTVAVPETHVPVQTKPEASAYDLVDLHIQLTESGCVCCGSDMDCGSQQRHYPALSILASELYHTLRDSGCGYRNVVVSEIKQKLVFSGAKSVWPKIYRKEANKLAILMYAEINAKLLTLSISPSNP